MLYRLQYVPLVLAGALHRHAAPPAGARSGVSACWRGLSSASAPAARGNAQPGAGIPRKSRRPKRRKILRGVYRSLGRLLGEFCLFPSYTPANVSQVAVYQGFENFEAAEKRGKGVLFLTGHFGGWEIGSFFHSLQGHPMRIVVRPLDNPYVDELVTRYRTLHGNTMIGKQEFARGLLAAMR